MNLKRVIFAAALLALLIMPLTANGANVVKVNYTIDNVINIASDSALDITDVAPVAGHYVISGTTDYNTIFGYVVTGYNSGSWNGLGGIYSDLAAADPAKLSLAVISGDDYRTLYPGATFHGNNVSTSAALVHYTYLGDANLDGNVDGSDLTLLLNSFIYQTNHSALPTGGNSWLNGNFNYDANIDGSDLTLLLNQFIYQTNHGGSFIPTLPTHMSAGGTDLAPVPEPSTLVLLLVGLASLVSLRKIWK
ncbi:MAG: PEP-CTERM sorting domain-containing protein [Thermoguttaceae bacterium]